MTDSILENNSYFRYLQNELQDQLSKWIEPNWLVCVPVDSAIKDLKLTNAFVASQVLYALEPQKSQYSSELFGSSLVYEITGEDPRIIIWNDEKSNEVLVSRAVIKNEYLITVQEHVVHVLLIDRLLPSMIEDDQSFLPQIMSVTVTSNRQAEELLSSFRCHHPILESLRLELLRAQVEVFPGGDVDQIQCCIHGLILQAWESLIKRHLPELQANCVFQDLLFRALDFFAVGICHDELWNKIVSRCSIVDQMVKSRVNYLKSSDISPSQLGITKDLCTPLPAAIVEMANLNARLSAIEKLHCVRDSLELIQAQTKEVKAMLYEYKDTDASEHQFNITQDELVILLMVVLVQAQCFSLVANIYYMTHYVFSVPDELHPLWQSLSLLRNSLEQIMKLDIAHLPEVNHPMRKELSLQDLMQVSADVELRFESHHSKGSLSVNDISALDLQLQQLTKKIHQSTQAVSETQLNDRNSPSRRSDRGSDTQNICTNQSQSKIQSFVEFLSSIPSTIRASFRRRQSEHRTAIHSSIEI